MADTVLIFAKPPRTGLGKTRLARDIGRSEARRFNRFAQARVLCTVQAGARARGWVPVLCVAPDSAVDAALPRVWPPSTEIARWPQGTGDLGQRLTRAMARATFGRVLVIGTDTPQVSRADLIAAFAALKRHDAVVGPARDGGFWLAGFRKDARWLSPFWPVRWSSEHALLDLADNLAAHGKSVARLRMLTDVDDACSLQSARAEAGWRPACAGMPSSGV